MTREEITVITTIAEQMGWSINVLPVRGMLTLWASHDGVLVPVVKIRIKTAKLKEAIIQVLWAVIRETRTTEKNFLKNQLIEKINHL